MMFGASSRPQASPCEASGCSSSSSSSVRRVSALACTWRRQQQRLTGGCHLRWPGRLSATSQDQHDAPAGATEVVPELVVQRVSETGASRKAFSRAFTKLLGLELADPNSTDPASLFNTNFPAYTPALSTIQVQQKREYVTGRTYTDTDAGYLAFFVAMHAAALIGGPLTFSQDALEVCLAGYVITGMFGISMSYHRQLSHKSFRCHKLRDEIVKERTLRETEVAHERQLREAQRLEFAAKVELAQSKAESLVTTRIFELANNEDYSSLRTRLKQAVVDKADETSGGGGGAGGAGIRSSSS